MNDPAKKKETLAKLDVAIANAEKIGSKTGDAGRTLGKNFQESVDKGERHSNPKSSKVSWERQHTSWEAPLVSLDTATDP